MKLKPTIKPVAYKATGNFKPVQSGLAMTPAQIKELTDKGIAVSSHNASQEASESSTEKGFEVDPLFSRDMDMNTAWEQETQAKKKVLTAQRVDRKRYGTSKTL